MIESIKDELVSYSVPFKLHELTSSVIDVIITSVTAERSSSVSPVTFPSSNLHLLAGWTRLPSARGISEV